MSRFARMSPLLVASIVAALPVPRMALAAAAVAAQPALTVGAADANEIGTWPDISITNRVLTAAIGIPTQRYYWVQLASETTVAEATQDVAKLRAQHGQLGYAFRVYPSYTLPGHFAVLMEGTSGPLASLADADKARQVALENGLSGNPFVFVLPRSK
jgi:hypothetical protein